MPSQVRIISPRNSREWDELIAAAPLGEENTYGGIAHQQRADEVRRKLRTAAKRRSDLGAKVFWYQCEAKRCQFGDDCQYHVSYTIYPIDVARQYKAQQAAGARR